MDECHRRLRTENASIFFVRRFPGLAHLLVVSSLAQKIFCLECLDFESSRGWLLKLGNDTVKLIYDSDLGVGLPIPEDTEAVDLSIKAS